MRCLKNGNPDQMIASVVEDDTVIPHFAVSGTWLFFEVWHQLKLLLCKSKKKICQVMPHWLGDCCHSVRIFFLNSSQSFFWKGFLRNDIDPGAPIYVMQYSTLCFSLDAPQHVPAKKAAKRPDDFPIAQKLFAAICIRGLNSCFRR